MKNFWKKNRFRILVTFALATLGFIVRRVMLDIPLNVDLALYGYSFFIIYSLWWFFGSINERLDTILPFQQNMPLRMGIQLFAGVFFLAILRWTSIGIFGDYLPLELNTFTTSTIILLDVFFALAVNLALITHYFIQRWKEGVVKTERLEKEKSMMRYHNLKNQVNPHFLFNSLSSLQSLVKSNPDLASQYISHLSKVYRYVLQNKEKEVVSIETELRFIEHYISLLNIRYGDALHIDLRLSEAAKDRDIVMVTLQMLIDNAIKHNEVHPKAPLTIAVFDQENYLLVQNNLQKRSTISGSNQQGLEQLRTLYSYLSENPVLIEQTEHQFTIKIPLL
ncbi:MAG: histidine kinase [Saprospiraceae bacterium]|nr:histidine kinase [Saprospiraceae bacterium]